MQGSGAQGHADMEDREECQGRNEQPRKGESNMSAADIRREGMAQEEQRLKEVRGSEAQGQAGTEEREKGQGRNERPRKGEREQKRMGGREGSSGG